MYYWLFLVELVIYSWLKCFIKTSINDRIYKRNHFQVFYFLLINWQLLVASNFFFYYFIGFFGFILIDLFTSWLIADHYTLYKSFSSKSTLSQLVYFNTIDTKKKSRPIYIYIYSRKVKGFFNPTYVIGHYNYKL